jgi:hypothetical protein
VAEMIDTLSEDDGIEAYADRKRALRRRVLGSGRNSILIYAADRVANMRDWRKVPLEDREQIGIRLDTSLDERLELWSEDLEELTRLDPDLPFLAEIELELRELREEAPSHTA